VEREHGANELARLAPATLYDNAVRSIAERDWYDYLLLFSHEARPEAFLAILPELDDYEYWSMLAEAWSSAEAPGTDGIDWRALFTDPRPGRAWLMNEDEQTNHEMLPEYVTVYRGVGHPDYALGLAWTLDRNQAAWFAVYASKALARSRGKAGDASRACVVRGTVAKADVLDLFEGREEQEVLVLPESVRDLWLIEPAEERGPILSSSPRAGLQL
jgi:hypothetical protein